MKVVDRFVAAASGAIAFICAIAELPAWTAFFMGLCIITCMLMLADE